MIDRQSISLQVRGWAEELTGLGFHRTEAPAFWEEGRPSEELYRLTARGTATRVRRKPQPKVERLSAEAQRCEEILGFIERVDHRYRRALVLYSCVRPITAAAQIMRRNMVDFARFSEGGFALYALLDKRGLQTERATR